MNRQKSLQHSSRRLHFGSPERTTGVIAVQPEGVVGHWEPVREEEGRTERSQIRAR